MNVDNKARARAWFSNAEGDLAAVARLIDDLPHLSCFHAQQAVEKALKAVLTAKEGDIPQTHVIRELLDACKDAEIITPDDLPAHALSLEKFYVPTRYPDALGWADAASAFNLRDAELARDDAIARESRIARRVLKERQEITGALGQALACGSVAASWSRSQPRLKEPPCDALFTLCQR